MNLYIDTATSDRWLFPVKGMPRPDNEQPHMVRLAWLLESEDGSTEREACHLIRMPQGQRMAGEAQHHTGIYDHHLQERGKGMFDVLSEFAEALGELQYGVHVRMPSCIVAHSWAFHRQVLERSFRYVGMPAREWPLAVCAMIKATDIVQIPKQAPGGGYKWPSFDQCCERFTGGVLKPTTDPVFDGNSRARAVRVFYSHIRREALHHTSQP